MTAFLLSCSAQAAEQGDAGVTRKINVVVTFSILADFVHQVGGDTVEIYSLVKPGSDSHMYEPTPVDVEMVQRADLVIVNGLGFEGWISRLTESSGYQGKVVIATEGITPLLAEHDEEAHKHDTTDPHAWQNVLNVTRYVMNINRALKEQFPQQADKYDTNAKNYIAELAGLDAEIKDRIGKVPPEKRKVITSHDAFAYYASAYGVKFLSPLGMSTDSEPSAGTIARLIDQVRAEKVTALFVENISNKRLVQQLEADTGVRLGGTLYSDALSPVAEGAATYIDMMRYNTGLLVTNMSQTVDKK